MSVDVCKACGENAKKLYPIGKKKYLGTDIPQIICDLLHVTSEPTFGNSLICSSCITALRLIRAKIEDLYCAFAPPPEQMRSDFGGPNPNETNSANSHILTKMSVDMCKVCGGNAKESYPIGTKRYFGIDIPPIICNLFILNSKPTFGNSLICTSCITALHLINGKIEYLRRKFAPPTKQIHSDIESSTSNKSNSVNSKAVPEIRKSRRLVNVETPKKIAPSKTSTSRIALSKKTPIARNSAKTTRNCCSKQNTGKSKRKTR